MPNDPQNTDGCDKHNREDCMECFYTTRAELPDPLPEVCPYCNMNIPLPKHDEEKWQIHLKGHNTPDPLIEEYVEKFDEQFVELHPMNGQDMYNPPLLYQAPFEDIEEIKNFLRTSLKEYGDKRVGELQKWLRKKGFPHLAKVLEHINKIKK